VSDILKLGTKMRCIKMSMTPAEELAEVEVARDTLASHGLSDAGLEAIDELITYMEETHDK
jgi:hypothetical protein